MCDDGDLNELLKIVDLAVPPIAADSLVHGTVHLALRPPLLQVLADIFNIQSDGSTSRSYDDVILTETQRLKLDRFLNIIYKIPVLRLKQRSVESYNNAIDLGVFHCVKTLVLEHINLQNLRCTSHLKSQLVRMSGNFCSEIKAIFSDKLFWAELVDLTLSYCSLDPSNNGDYFRNAPWLKILNLSHCKLRSCDFLLNLPLLEHVNLSFNFLKKMPLMRDGNNLQTLKMDNNCIQDLAGIERIPSLKYFDLSYNWIPNKFSLKALENLENLVTIKLTGCPVSFIKYYRIYVAMCICTSTPPAQVMIDGKALNKTEQSVLGFHLPPRLSETPAVDISLPSTSNTGFEEASIPSHTTGSSPKKPKFKKSSIRVPLIHDESTTSPVESDPPSRLVEPDADVPRAPSVIPKGPITSEDVALTAELRAIRQALLRAPTSSQAKLTGEGGMHRTPLRAESPKLYLGGVTIPNFATLEDPSPLPEIIPEKVFALVHATETRSKDAEKSRKSSGNDPYNDSRYRVTFEHQVVDEKELAYRTPNFITREESFEELEDKLFASLDIKKSDDIHETEKVKEIQRIDDPSTACSDTSLEEPTINVQYDSKTWDHNSDSGAGSDMKTSAESMVAKESLETDEKPGPQDHESPNSGQPTIETQVSDEEFCSTNSGDNLEVVKNVAEELAEVSVVTALEKRSENSNGSPKDSDEESCYESDPDADEFLWHVMRVDPTTKVHQPIFLALLENELKERSPKSGETLTKWPLEMVMSCVKTKNLPITIEMEFDTTKKDKQHREYIMEYADAQALTKKIYNILESRPLSAMNQVSHSCLKCSTIFVYSHSSVRGAEECAPSCPVCGSTVVVETEEPKMPEAKVPPPKPLSHSPSLSSIGSARSIEHGQKPEVLMNPRKYESDIEVISNPSQSSIEVIDESSRSQSVTPMRKKSEERQTSVEQNIRDVLSPLSALTESSSSGSLTESVITAYESSSVIINKKSVECLPEASCENSPSENSMPVAAKGITDEENGNFPRPKSAKDVYSYTDFLDVELRVKTFIYHSIFKSENENFNALVKCHIWKTGGSDYDGCFVLSTTALYFLYHKMTDFSDQICDWLSLNESFRLSDLKRVQPVIWYQGLELQIKDFSFILLLMDGDRTQNLVKHFNDLALKGVKIMVKPNPKMELSLQQAILSNDLNHNSEDPSVVYMTLCRSLEITKIEVQKEEILRLAGLVLTCGLFIVIPGDLSWLCSGAQPSVVASHDLSSLIEVEKKGLLLVLHFLDETEAAEELWSVKFENDSQLDSLLNAIRRPWERRFSVPLEVTGL